MFYLSGDGAFAFELSALVLVGTGVVLRNRIFVKRKLCSGGVSQ